MRSSLVKLEPETLEIPAAVGDRPAEAVLNVTNVSASVLPGLFFCLYNQEKFDIVPENFSLQPSESKTVTIRLRLLESERRTAHKEYAYLKSSVVSKRITILVGHQEGSAGITNSRLTDQQIEASLGGSLASHRNFEAQGRSGFQPPHIEQSRFTALGFEQELDNYNNSTKAAELFKQLSQAEADNLELKRKLRFSDSENERLKRELEMARLTGEQHSDTNYKMLYEKEKTLYCQLKEELERIYSERNLVDVRRKDAEAQLHHRDMRIKHLEHDNTQLTMKLVEAEAEGSELKGKHLKSSKELILREEQLRHIRGELEVLKESIDAFEAERVKYIKLEFENGKLQEANASLQQQVEKLQASANQHKQEALRLEAIREHTQQAREGTDKARQYLSMALESSKIEAETLRMSKQELERLVQQLMETQKDLAVKLKSKQAQFEELQRQRLVIHDQILQMSKENSQLSQQARQLQTVKAEQGALKKKLLAAEHRILTMENQLQEANQERDQTVERLRRTEAEQQRYKSDVTRQLDVIKNSTMKEMSKLSSTKMKRQRHEDQHETVVKNTEKTQPHPAASPYNLDNTTSAAKSVRPIESQEQIGSEQRNRIRSRSSHHIDGSSGKRLQELVEVVKVFEIEQRKVCQQLGLHDEPSLQSPMLKLLSFFRQLQFKLGELTATSKQENEYLEEIRKLKFELIDKETALKSRTNLPEKTGSADESACDKQQKLLQFIQEEMRSQYARLSTALTFANQKYEVLKRKVYNEYRFRIVQLLNGKTTDVRKLETLLERLIEGLSNLSHKEAMLHRNSKKHQESLKQNKALKHRIHELDWLLGEKTTAPCTRSPVQVLYALPSENGNIIEGIRCESQLLSCRAELSQVTQELACTAENFNTANQQITNLTEVISRRDAEIARLKTQFLELERLHKSELVDALDEMESMRIHSLRVNELEEQLAAQIQKSKNNLMLKDDLSKKKELIRGLKDREKSLVQVIQDIRQHIEEQEKAKPKSKEEVRLQEAVADFRERNKELKAELDRRAENQRKLQDDLERKNNLIASLKTTIGIKEREQKDQQREDASKLKSEKKHLETELKETKANAAKAQRELETLKKRLGELEGELTECEKLSARLNEDLLVKEKSLMSSIRSLVEILRRVWRSVEIKVRKARHTSHLSNFEIIVADPLRIDILRLYDEFEGMLNALREPTETNASFS